MENFVYISIKNRVIFGTGSIKTLGDLLSESGRVRPFIVCTRSQTDNADNVRDLLQEKVSTIFSEAVEHTPIHVTEQALKLVKTSNADSVISIGGGSAIGLGKAISINAALYHIAVPTTYAGSEATPVLGETINGNKNTRVSDDILPNTIIYDANLSLSLPIHISAKSGINAIAHAVEALYAKDCDPVTITFAKQGVQVLAEALLEIIQQPGSQAARSTALYGAWLCGICLANVGMSLHHKLCHVLGGSLSLPHADTHAIILPHALAYNAPNVPEALRILAEALPDSNGDAINGLNLLLKRLDAPKSLRQLGMQEGDIERATDAALLKPYWNPRPITREGIKELIRRAWAGEMARADF